MDIFYKLLFEILIFLVLGLLYYFFQKRKIYSYIEKERNYALNTINEICHELINSDKLPTQELNIVKQILNALDDLENQQIQNLPYSIYKDVIYTFDDSSELKLIIMEFKQALFNEEEN